MPLPFWQRPFPEPPDVQQPAEVGYSAQACLREPASFASGMVIEGITGRGKSQVVDRYLGLYPQVVEHGPNHECGWAHLKQLVWLKIHMPADGSRGGFLLNGLLEMDRLLETDYAAQYAFSTMDGREIVGRISSSAGCSSVRIAGH